jgi:hypothetical protein
MRGLTLNWDRFSDPSVVAFSVLDLDARPEFWSATSVSFRVEWNSQDHEEKFRKGWIDVHYPCRDWRKNKTKAVVRVSLSEPYPDLESQYAILDAIFRALDIPEGTPFEALFFSETMACGIVDDPYSMF